MKLILSSADFRNGLSAAVIRDHLPKPIGECTLLFLPNEHARHDVIRSGKFHRRLAEFGFDPALVSVFDAKVPDLTRGMHPDVVYISGGNTFRMAEIYRAAGFDLEVARAVSEGSVFVGGSAGAHLLTPDLRHAARYDEVPEGFDDYSGLGLFPRRLICHFSEERRAHFEELKKDTSFPVAAIGNDGCIVYENGVLNAYGTVLTD